MRWGFWECPGRTCWPVDSCGLLVMGLGVEQSNQNWSEEKKKKRCYNVSKHLNIVICKLNGGTSCSNMGLTLSLCSNVGEDSGMTDIGVRRFSIMDITVSGTLVASVHLSCQLGSLTVSISLACGCKCTYSLKLRN